eukprot:gnl/TRDRNA2_/TRDRNA2_173959_c2_seq85.p1 gnl/TRDRNA2_/TRDRNA2_173959_c2~~gnl/TRDRNA2_/TRDRNA2_173959_c2_seq85.p1  ORF type:complete len:574 (-),score=159.45 gnl/TRDRNA2_/TRDRNA2_173959_c2_seq85:116-1837(-)
MAAAPASSVPQFASLYVGDLNPDVTEAMLYEIFNNVGPVASIRVCRDSVTRRSLGYAYVNYHGVSDAERALDTLNYTTVKGRSCRIMWSQRDPSLRKSGVGNVFVKNLDPNIDNKALYDTFSLFGNILTCKVVADSQGKSRGYGFVHYETEEAAKQAIERVNGMQIGDKTVQVAAFVKKAGRDVDTDNYTNLYVKCFPDDWDEDKLTKTFEEYGPITSATVMTDPKGRKFGFVAFESNDDAKKAVEAMHKKDLRADPPKDEKEEDMEKDESGHPKALFYCQRAKSKAERRAEFEKERFGEAKGAPSTSVNLYIKNLDDATDDAALRELFVPFAKSPESITSAVTAKDTDGKCKGFGFVTFASADEATRAVTEMHLKVIKGKPLYVGLAEKRAAREERLRQRYTPSMDGGKGGKGGKGGGMQMYGGGMMGGGMPGMMPGMMGGARPQGMMYPQGMQGMVGMKGGAGMMGGAPRPMMGGPQMMQMQMMGKGGPNMMGMPNPMMMMGKGMPPMGMMRPPQQPQQQPQQLTGDASQCHCVGRLSVSRLCRSFEKDFWSPFSLGSLVLVMPALLQYSI